MDKRKILVVDDERIAVRNLKYILTKEGYDVDTARNGSEALNLLDASIDKEYDVVLTDLRMPEVDGMQILKKSKDLFPNTEVIMITGFSTVKSAIDALKGGAYHYVAKPYNLDEVRKIVYEAIEKKELKREIFKLKEKLAKIEGASIIN